MAELTPDQQKQIIEALDKRGDPHCEPAEPHLSGRLDRYGSFLLGQALKNGLAFPYRA